jgi:hypothetical protein
VWFVVSKLPAQPAPANAPNQRVRVHVLDGARSHYFAGRAATGIQDDPPPSADRATPQPNQRAGPRYLGDIETRCSMINDGTFLQLNKLFGMVC